MPETVSWGRPACGRRTRRNRCPGPAFCERGSWPPYRGRMLLLPLPGWGKIRKAVQPHTGAAMPRLNLTILLLLPFLTFGAFAVTAADNDPYAWLEDVHGAKPLAWVAEQNKKSLSVLK